MSETRTSFRLSELEGELLRLNSDRTMSRVDSLCEAHGLFFLCPKCFAENGGNVGTHGVLCWFADRGVPDDLDPRPGRWHPFGTTIEDISFGGPVSFSVQLTSGCMWHGFIVGGEARPNSPRV